MDFLIKYFNTLSHIIFHILIWAGVVTGFIRYTKLCTPSKILLTLLILTPVVELIAFYFALTIKKNAFVYNPFTILQCILLAMIFYTETRFKTVIYILIIFLASAIFNGIYIEPFFTVANHKTHLLESLVIIVWYFLFLTAYFKKEEIFSLKSYPVFWLGMGWTVFSIVAIVSFGFNLLTDKDSVWYTLLTYAKYYSNYLLYASFIPAFLCSQKSLNDFTTGK